ncbi:unnamed protein product, partial [Porites lobata]
NASQNEDPYYNGYLFAARNQTRPQGINNTGNTLYGVSMAQNQPPLHYPAMLNPYPIYQNPVPGTSNHLQFEPDRDSASPTQQFQSMCFDNGVESEKSLAQLKEKWRALLDKYKSVCDNNNRTGRERKTFKHYEDIDEFMASSDKVNQDFSDDTDDILSTGNQDCSKKTEKRPPSSAGGDSADAEKTGKTGQKDEKGPKKKKKRLSGDDME